MKRIFLLFIVLLFKIALFAQGQITLPAEPFVIKLPMDSTILLPILTDSNSTALTEEEKEIIYWINFVRKNPRTFKTHILNPFLAQFPTIKNSYTRTLSNTLSHQNSLVPLNLSPILIKFSKSHALDLSKHPNNFSHNSSDASTFRQRAEQFGLEWCIAENIYQGKNDPLLAVLLLLIDSGVPDLGHRKNILDPSHVSIGVSFIPNSYNSYFSLVQDFSCNH